EPYERMMRDARINQIGEGANEVLKAFIAVVGLRGVGEALKGVLGALRNPLKEMGTLWHFGKNQLAQRLSRPEVPVHNPSLKREAKELGARIREFGIAVQQTLAHFRKKALHNGVSDKGEELAIMEVVLKSQYLQERLADAACDLYASSCSLARLDHLLSHRNGRATESDSVVQAGPYFLALANRRIKQNLAALWDNDDELTTRTANAFLADMS